MWNSWNKLSNPVKLVFIFLFVVLVVCIGMNLKNKRTTTPTPDQPGTNTLPTKTPAVSIAKRQIKEENFSGSMPVITGSGVLADAARVYVDTAVNDFRKSAKEEVPPMRKQFGADSPTANYTFDLDAKYVDGPDYASIVVSGYAYTGGANGNSFYEVFTASRFGQKVLSLKDIIDTARQADFTRLVKSELLAWRPQGSTSTVVFEDTVSDLTFQSFTNWSLNDKNLTLYFNKYDIGPGVLGAVEFPIPLTKVKDYLE